jgi:two-component system response regulator AtoC
LVSGSPFVTHERTSLSLSEPDPRPVIPLDDALRQAEHRALAGALRAAGNNRSQAARLLGICRATLYNKLKEHGLS